MTVQGLIDRLQTAIEHGQNPDAEMQAWDPDMEGWYRVTVLVMDSEKVRIYTDEP